MSASIRMIKSPLKAGVYQARITLTGTESQRAAVASALKQNSTPTIGPWKLGTPELPIQNGYGAAYGLIGKIEECFLGNQTPAECPEIKGLIIRPGSIWPYDESGKGGAPTHLYAFFILDKDILPAANPPQDATVKTIGPKQASVSIVGTTSPPRDLAQALGQLGTSLMKYGANWVTFKEIQQSSDNLTRWALQAYKEGEPTSAGTKAAGATAIILALLAAYLLLKPRASQMAASLPQWRRTRP